jgi:Bacterial Ig domain
MFKQTLSLLVGMFWVFAFSASAQPPETEVCSSVVLLDAEGQPATQFREGDQILVRVVAPALNFVSSLRDEAYMVLSAQGSGDQEALSAYETGPDTGVFERRIRLTFGSAYPQDGRLQTGRTDHISVQCGAYPPVAEADVLGPTVHFLDAGGHETATVATGFPLRLRAADHVANMSPWSDMNQVRLVVPGGDNEVVTLLETGSLTAIFEASIPLVEGPAVPGDGTLQVAAGSTVEARLLDIYGTTLATATATAAQRLLTFRDAAGAPLSTLIEGAAVRVELLDAIDAGQTGLYAIARSQIAGDEEYVNLTPDPNLLGRFEGTLYLGPYLAYPYNGHLTTYRTYSQPYQFDTVTVQFCDGCPTATATITNPEIRLLDTAGRDATVFAAGTPVRVRVFYPMLYPGYPETYARLESLTTGDLLSYLVLGATGGSVFEGQASTATGAAAADNILQVQPGEILKATHIDYMNQPSSSITARIQEATLEFTDAAGAPQSEFLIGRPVYLRAVDPTANANPAQAETLIASIDVEIDTGFPRDRETLTLTETGPNTGLFTGSIPMAPYASYSFGNGVLEASADFYRGDVLHARLADASATASTVQSQLRFVDAQGNDVELYPMGSTVYVRLEEPLANQPGQQDQGMVRIHSFSTGDWELLLVTETGMNTGIFTGSMAIGSGPASFYSNVLEVEAGETIEADHNSYNSVSADRASFAPNRAPVVQNESVSILEDNSITVDVLANDSDPEGQPLTVTNVVPYYGGGTVTINPDSSITYTPGPESFGYTELLTYTVSDGSLTATGTLSVEVVSVNDPPVAGDDARTTNEDVPVLLSVLDNDSDAEGQLLEVVGFSTPAHGTVEPHPLFRGDYSYIPAPDFNGTDSFTYTLRDADGATSTGTVTVTVEPMDDPPFVLDDTATTAEDTAVTIAVLANDSDVDTTLTVGSVSQPAHGSAVVNGGATVTYTPAPNFSGTDSFDYFIPLGPSSTAVATVTVTVTPINDAPDAVNDSATTNEDAAVTVSVLGNDTDPENNTLTVTAATQGTKGTVTINGGATVTYTPNANANGSDSFTYTISDGNGGTDTTTVSITITAVNDAPDAVNDSATTNEDAAVTVSVLGNDTDPENNALTITAVTQGTKGTVSINGTAILYTPNANANGTDSFTYTISDGNGGTDTAAVAITINSINDPPDAINDVAATAEDMGVMITVLANDVDLDGEVPTVTGVTQGSKGAVILNANGTVTYVPAANTNGADAFTYTVRDGSGSTDTATVMVSVAPVNDPPAAANDTATTREGAAVTINVLANDSDVEGNALTVTGTSTPGHGSTSINSNIVTYTPATNFNGTDTFTYTISDGQGGTASATVTVTVKDALERTAILATHGVWIQTGADVLSGDVIVNQTGAAPFLDSGVELSVAGTVTTPVGYDVQANRINVAAGSTLASDAFYNTRTGAGSVTGTQTSPLTLPVFASLPAFPTATPGTTDVNVAANGTRTLAPGSYRDLIVGKKGTVTFTGGIYHFRSIQLNSQVKLFFSAAAEIRVQQKVSTLDLVQIKPAAGATIDGSDIIFFVAGLNGTGGGLAETPKAVEIGTDGVIWANVYAPNGTIWLKDRTQARGAHLGKDVQAGPDVQVTLDSYWIGQ